MPTVIDSFVITLGLDPAQFTAGQRELMDNLRKMQEQAEKGGKEIESQGKKFGDYFSTVKREALGALAIFVGGRGIKEFVGYMTGLDAATARVGHTMNISAREVSAWQGAIEQNGGSAESATGALAGLSGEMNKFMLTGQTSMLPVLNTLDISLIDVNKKLKTSDQLLLDIADRIKGMDPARAAAMLSMVPGMNQDMLNLLIQGRAEVEAYLAAARAAGGTTAESAAAAKKYQESLALLSREATNTSRVLLTELTPAIVGAFRSFQNTIKNGVTGGLPFWDWFFKPMTVTITPGSWAESFLKKVFPDWLPGGPSAATKPSPGLSLYPPPFLGEPGATPTRPGTAISLPVKPGAGASSPETRRAMDALAGLPGINRVTALSDPFHALLGSSPHNEGRALDLTVKDPAQAAAVADAIRTKLAAAGIAASVINEYDPAKRSRGSTAPHIHVTVLPTMPRGPTVGAAAAASREGGGDDRRTSVMNVGTMNVTLPGVKNADDFARDIKPVMERGNNAASFNNALR